MASMSIFFSLILENHSSGFSKTSLKFVELVARTLSYCWSCSHATEKQNVFSVRLTAKTVELMDK